MNLEALDKQYVLQTYARDYTNFTHGIGSKLYDDKGVEYIDFASGIGVSSVGHANKHLTQAICEQAQKIIHISNLQVIEPQAKLAKKIVELCGYDAKVFFANSGAEANEGAIKMARKYGTVNFDTKKYKIISLGHSFHGRTLSALTATAQESFHPDTFAPYPKGFSYVANIDDIYDAIDEETIAVIIELTQGEGGVMNFDKHKVQELAKFLQEKKLLLIVDEIQTGIYRTGSFLESNNYEITPDIVTVAKGLGGGVPIGAIITRHKEILSAGEHGTTFGGNYLSTAAGLAVLDILSELKQGGQLQETIEYFDKKLDHIIAQYSDLFIKKTGLGLMRGIVAKDDAIKNAVIKNAMKQRVIVLKSGRNTVRFLPSLTITKEEIDEGFARFEKALSETRVS